MKMEIKKFFLVSSTILAVALSGCSNDSEKKSDDGCSPVTSVQATDYTALTSYTVPSSPGTTVADTGTIPSTITGVVVVEGPTANLTGPTKVASGGELHIKAGTTITASDGTGEANTSVLIVDRGGKIFAVGSAGSPIVMTSQTKSTGKWGGIVINGNSHYASTSGTGDGEGGSGTFGGGTCYNVNDNSGILSYVELRYPGTDYTVDNQLNGIAFQAVGSQTIVQNVAVMWGKDDGIEMFGGTVNLKNIFIYGAHDDQLDWTSGWTGSAQNVVLTHYTESDGDSSSDPRGIEADNDEDNNDITPRSNPTIANLTLVGNGDDMENIARIRRGTYLRLYNAYIANFTADDDVIKLSEDATKNSIDAGNTFIKGSLFENINAYSLSLDSLVEGPSDAQKTKFISAAGNNNKAYSASLTLLSPTAAFDSAAEYKPDSNEVGETINSSIHANFDDATYIGGVDAGSNWTTFISNFTYGS